MRVRVGRNLAAFPLPGRMTKAHRLEMEQQMLKAFKKLMADPAYGGRYYSLTPGIPESISKAKYQVRETDSEREGESKMLHTAAHTFEGLGHQRVPGAPTHRTDPSSPPHTHTQYCPTAHSPLVLLPHRSWWTRI
jgi:hypothetical protein